MLKKIARRSARLSDPRPPMRVVFAGTPEFARVALERLQAAGFAIAAGADAARPARRPGHEAAGVAGQAMGRVAPRRRGAAAQPAAGRQVRRRRGGGARRRSSRARPDVMVVAAYGLILPPWVLDLPRLGCLNIHASLLPRWRGAAPIHRAIEAGDRETGITIMQMDAGLDTGDMLLTARRADPPRRHHRDPARPAGRARRPAGRRGARTGRVRRARARRAADDGVTYAHKIEKAEAPIDWRPTPRRSSAACAPSIRFPAPRRCCAARR